MIFRTFRALFRKGYVQKEKSTTIQFFFETANLSIRRKVLEDIGFFDTNCITAEDMDINCRAMEKGWNLFYEPDAKIYHFHRKTFQGLCKQWFFYGYGQSYVYKKFNRNRFTLLIFSSKRKACLYKVLFNIPFVFPAVVFINPFLILNLTALFFISTITLSSPDFIKTFSALLFGGAFLLYIKKYININNLMQSLYFILLRYCLSVAFVLGAFLGGIRYGVLDLHSAVDINDSN